MCVIACGAQGVSPEAQHVPPVQEVPNGQVLPQEPQLLGSL